MGQPGRKCLKISSCQKIQNVRLIMPLANRLVPSPPAKLCGGKGSGKGGLLGSFPPRFAYFAMSALNKEFAGGGTVLEHHGIGHGFEPLHTLRHFRVTAAMA